MPRFMLQRMLRIAASSSEGGGSYALGVIAAGLEYVVDQKTDGTVGLSGVPLTNSTTAYLIAQGATIDWIESSVYFATGATIENVDFTVLDRKVYFDIPDTDTVSMTNCKFGSRGLSSGQRPGGNTAVNPPSNIIATDCEFDGAEWGTTQGKLTATRCMFKNTVQSQYFTAGGGTTFRELKFYQCVMTMSDGDPQGVTPPHLEYIQIGGDQDGSLYMEDTLLDITDTIGTIYEDEAAWTGVISVGVKTRLKNVVFAGIKELNDWCATVPTEPLVRCFVAIAWNDGSGPELDNVVLGNSPNGGGYCFKQLSGSVNDSATAVTTCYDYDTGEPLETADLN